VIRKVTQEDADLAEDDALLDFPAASDPSPTRALPSPARRIAIDPQAADYASLPDVAQPPSPPDQRPPTPPAHSPATVTTYLRHLKTTPLGDAVVHEETIPPLPERLAGNIDHLGPEVRRVMDAAGIGDLWTHQEEGLRHIQAGRNVVLATPTASGKTLVYNAAVLSSMIQDPRGHALYIFPLKALEHDQLDELQSVLHNLGPLADDAPLTVEVYDGDTKPHIRKKIKEHPPNILISTPDMLHAGILAFHEAWEEFFKHLKYVVIDELHTYSGIFGSHILHVMRRLNRICAACGSRPQYITCSATIGNPEELAGKLFNRDFVAVTDSGAPTATRHFVFLNPAESPNTVAARLLATSVAQQLRTIVFTRARVITELIYRWATQGRPELLDRISSYRAGYMPEERRQIEASLLSGDLLGVVSTSALELGIDIGGLDVCILVGYPGSIVNTWQRAGRVGRSGRESLVLLIASRDALDQFFMNHPRHFFERHIENAVVDPSNKYIMKSHMVCAAREIPLSLAEPEYDIPGWQAALEELTAAGEILQSADGDAWFASRKQPHRLVNMRTIGESWSICLDSGSSGDGEGKKTVIGTVSGGQLYTECHEGALYLHRGRQYLIGERNPVKRQIDIQQVDVPYYTRPKQEKETEVIEELRSKPMHGYMARIGRLLVSSQVIAYEKVRVGDQAILSRHSLESPVETFETVGFWIEMEESWKKDLKAHGFRHMGSLHATEHAVKSLFPLLALSKQTDVGGICYPMHPQFGKGAIFIYDQYPGGIGLAETGFDMLDRLFELTLEFVSNCDCDEGCPSCIHFPTCGAGNKPLDKAGCIHLLELLTGRRELATEPQEHDAIESEPPIYADWEEVDNDPPAADPSQQPHVVVFDLETQLSAAEVGGWNKTYLMRMSCGISWDSREDRFVTYLEDQVDDLIALLQRADLVVGFNIIGFDYSVLRGYTRFDFRQLNTLDMLREIRQHLKYRVSLDSLAKATLNTPKSANGLDALRWWKQGRMDLIEKYCRDDVKLTRDIFQHGVDKGYLLFDRKNEGRMRVPVGWVVDELCSPPEIPEPVPPSTTRLAERVPTNEPGPSQSSLTARMAGPSLASAPHTGT